MNPPAVAEGLAHCIVSKRTPNGEPLPAFLEDKRLLRLDIGLIMAGAKASGTLGGKKGELISFFLLFF